MATSMAHSAHDNDIAADSERIPTHEDPPTSTDGAVSNSATASEGAVDSEISASLLGLPAELLTGVLSHLPVHDIQHGRVVNSHLRNVVDEPSNTSLIFILDNSRTQHLHNTANTLIRWPAEVKFLDALRVIFTHRGLQIDETARNTDICCLARHWSNRRGARYVSFYTTEFIDAVVKLHIQLHEPDILLRANNRVPTIEGAFLEMVSDAAFRVLGTSKTDVADIYQRVLTEVWTGDRHAYLRRDSARNGTHFPDWPLTRLCHNTYSIMLNMSLGKRQRLRYWICTVKQLEKVLGVGLPVMPETGEFAYCVRTQWAYERVLGLLRGEVADRKTRARVVDELYIH